MIRGSKESRRALLGSILGCALLAGLSACTTATFTRSSMTAYPPKPENCDFAVLTQMPNEPVEEIGVIDIQAIPRGTIQDAPGFKSAIREKVCQAGGDFVVAEVNGLGWYVRGGVFRRSSDASPRVASQ